MNPDAFRCFSFCLHSGWMHRLVCGFKGVPCFGWRAGSSEMRTLLQLHQNQLQYCSQHQAPPHLVQEQRRRRGSFHTGLREPESKSKNVNTQNLQLVNNIARLLSLMFYSCLKTPTDMKITSAEASERNRSHFSTTTVAQSYYFGYVGFAFSRIQRMHTPSRHINGCHEARFF